MRSVLSPLFSALPPLPPFCPFSLSAILNFLSRSLVCACQSTPLFLRKYFLLSGRIHLPPSSHADGVVAGKLPDLELVFNELATEFQSIGLSLNKLKCELFTKGDCSQQASSSLPREVNGLEVLGAPVGSDEFVAVTAGNKVLKARGILRARSGYDRRPTDSGGAVIDVHWGLPGYSLDEGRAAPTHCASAQSA